MQALSDVDAFLRSNFAQLVAARGVPGAVVAVLHDGDVVDHAAGVLSTATQVETTPDSVFQIGSITKVWTATLVMQLVDDGLLDLDAPITRYLPAFRLADDAAASTVTARQLLSHQAGFEGDAFTDTGRGDDAIEKFLATIIDLPQLFAPGEFFSYNNAAFSVLGRVVEVLREKTWAAAVMEDLALPLGLAHVAPSAYEAVLFRAAVGHLGAGEDGVEVATPVWALPKSNEPAGSMFAMRARDLVAFAKMHLDGGVAANGTRVLSAASVRAMQERQIDLPGLAVAGDAWGLGWKIVVDGSPSVIGHDGSTIGQSAFLRVIPEAELVVAMLTNGGDVMGLFDDVVKKIVRDAGGVELPGPPTPPAEVIDVDLAPILGLYSNGTFDMTIALDEDGRVWLDSIPKTTMVAAGHEPEHVELVGLGPNALIAARPTMNRTHRVVSFIGDNGSGRHSFLYNYGRAIARAD